MRFARRVLLILAGLLSLSLSVGAADWPMLGHDIARSGATTDEVRPPFERKWYRAFPDEGIMSGVQPVVADGTAYIGTLRGILHAIDDKTGQDRWTFTAGGSILHACAAGGGKVYFGAADGKIYAVNSTDGKPAWTAQTGSAIWNAPVVYDSRVFIGSRDGRLYACDGTGGKIEWVSITGGPILSSPAIDAKSGRIYVGSEDMHVYAFELTTGKQIWRSPKLPGVSFRGYHPVIAPDGSVMITVTPCVCADTIQQIMLDMVKEVFGDFASWRHKKEENDRLRKENFALMEKPETYHRQMEYLRKRLADEPALQTFFVLDPATGKQKFVAPIAYAESMNGPAAPPLVTPQGKVIVKYSALLRSRYEHYSPFLNVGYLDTATGDIAPIMEQSRTYGWHDSLLLVHDEQSQLSVSGRVLFNTHQDNVNAMDLDTLKGYPQPMCHGVHEVAPGVANSIWVIYLSGRALPMGWEWFARGTAVYGGGSIIDVPVVIAGDSLYYLPTHEINAGVVLVAYRMQAGGMAGVRAPEPKDKLTADDWKKIQGMKWDWDTLGMARLDTVLKAGLPELMPGTRQRPLTDAAKATVEKVTDGQLDEVIWQAATIPTGTAKNADHRPKLEQAVEELISRAWQPLIFPAGKFPSQAYRLFIDPSETLYTLALAYPHLSPGLQTKVRGYVAAPPPANPSAIRSAYDPALSKLLRLDDDLRRSETARLYPLWLWAHTTGDWQRVQRDWPKLRDSIRVEPAKEEPDCGNARLAGLIAACRIARQMNDQATVDRLLPELRGQLRQRLVYELAHTEGGLLNQIPTMRTSFGRWHWLTPEIGRLLRLYAQPIHQHLMDVYVDYHRPTWWLAWNVELMWRNETNFMFPSAPMDIFAARAMILGQGAGELGKFIDQPWCKADEYYIQKLALLMNQ